LQVSMQAPVAANGSWHGSFTVPADAGNLSALGSLVTALCVTDGLPSLATLYTPQTFTVTPPPATTAPTTSTPGTTHPTTPTTKPHGPGTTTPVGAPPARGTTTPPPDDGPGSTLPVTGEIPGASRPTGSGPDSGGRGSGSATTHPRSGKVDIARATSEGARAADLNVPELPAGHGTRGSGLGWLSWLLVLALVAAAIGTPLWLRRSHPAPVEPADAGEGT
jgi:hypothetical protein